MPDKNDHHIDLYLNYINIAKLDEVNFDSR